MKCWKNTDFKVVTRGISGLGKKKEIAKLLRIKERQEKYLGRSLGELGESKK